MAPSILKKRKHEDTSSKRPSKKSRQQQQQQHYSSPSASSSSDADEDAPDFTPIQLADSPEDEESPTIPTEAPALISSKTLPPEASTSVTDSDPDSSSDHSSASNPTSNNPSQTSSSSRRQTQKRNDSTAFATSISAILSSKLTTTKRSDPVLSRSATAHDANASLANSKLEAKAKRKMREDRRAALERGRVKDVLLGTTAGGAAAGGVGDAGGVGGEGTGEGEKKSVGQLQEEERKLRKTAQRGVVKLFNAVRASQVKAEEARAKGGTRGRKEERVEEMSKLGFLEMVAAGGGGESGKAKGKEKRKDGMVGEGIEEA